MKNQEIREILEKYIHIGGYVHQDDFNDIIEEISKLESLQSDVSVSDEDIDKMALERYPVDICWYGSRRLDDNLRERLKFIEGARALRDKLQPKKD